MEEQKTNKRGRKSPWDVSLGLVHRSHQEYPTPIWELLRQTETKKLLNKMALDDEVKQKAWELGE